MSSVLPFTDFAAQVLRVRFTTEQVVLSRVCFDGIDPIDLSEPDREIARRLFGDVDRIPDEARHVIAWLKGARMGGTWICSLYLLYAALTADLSVLAAGEIAFAPVVAPDVKTARQGLRFALGAAHAAPAIAQCIESESADGFVLRRPDDGRLVSIECLAASRGGASLRGRTMVAGLLDESSFFRDPDTGVVNDSELYRAMVVRVLPGGKLCVISTAWLQSGLLWQFVQDNHGKPTDCVAAIAPTLLVRDDPRIRVVVDQERRRDPRNAAREFDCIPFESSEAAFFDPRAIQAAIDDGIGTLVVPEWAAVAVGADFGFRSDSSALVVAVNDGERIIVTEVVELQPSANAPLQPSSVVRSFAEVSRKWNARTVMADGHYREAIREHLRAYSLHFCSAPEGATGKLETHTRVRALLHEGRIRIPNNERLIRQLREVVSRPTPGGLQSITSPRWKTGGHGDLVSACVLAVFQVAQYSPKPPRQVPQQGTREYIEAEFARMRRDRERQVERLARARSKAEWRALERRARNGM